MPIRTQDAENLARVALLSIVATRRKIRLAIEAKVLDIMRKVYADNKKKLAEIDCSGIQTPLGIRYRKVLRLSQRACGITITQAGLEDRKFGPSRHALDIAIGMCAFGDETNRRMVGRLLGTSWHEYEKLWDLVSDRCKNIINALPKSEQTEERFDLIAAS